MCELFEDPDIPVIDAARAGQLRDHGLVSINE